MDNQHELDTISNQSNQNFSNTIKLVSLYGSSIVSLMINGQERLCLAQISNTLLSKYSYNEIHNRRVALGITCVQCTPVQLDQLRRAGAMPISSRRCGMITKREAERLVKSFLDEISPPKLPANFAFNVKHSCGWGCHGSFIPTRYNSSRAKCIKCHQCQIFFSPNKFIFHCHKPDNEEIKRSNISYHHPDAANFNAWRRHLVISDESPMEKILHAWEDVKAMFNGGNRKRLLNQQQIDSSSLTEDINSTDSNVFKQDFKLMNELPKYDINFQSVVTKKNYKEDLNTYLSTSLINYEYSNNGKISNSIFDGHLFRRTMHPFCIPIQNRDPTHPWVFPSIIPNLLNQSLIASFDNIGRQAITNGKESMSKTTTYDIDSIINNRF